MTDSIAQAGSVLHENLCSHVKRVFDRIVSGDMPELAAFVLVNSCDAMRRLGDGLRLRRPDLPVLVLDLPISNNPAAIQHFADDISILAEQLSAIGQAVLCFQKLGRSISMYSAMAEKLATLQRRADHGMFIGGSAKMQELYNRAVTEAPETFSGELDRFLDQETPIALEGVPVYLIGNVLANTEAISLFEDCGARPVGNDLCTGQRLIRRLLNTSGASTLVEYASGWFSADHCWRTIDQDNPSWLAEDILARVSENGAKGVIAHVAKFCDPYLFRLPPIREHLMKNGIQMLVLEGDCTLGSLGQQRTRIEAFIEMIGEAK